VIQITKRKGQQLNPNASAMKASRKSKIKIMTQDARRKAAPAVHGELEHDRDHERDRSCRSVNLRYASENHA
jgi:hypothetical protein